MVKPGLLVCPMIDHYNFYYQKNTIKTNIMKPKIVTKNKYKSRTLVNQ